ncbi:UNVERIFIED_CONTAM: hypothetical protein PYX00_006941 [Menopon gallinae]
MFVFLAGWTKAADVLFVAPLPAVSHYRMLEPLMLGLAERGHRVTVLSHYPQKRPVPNLTDVSLRGIVPAYELGFARWNLLEDAWDTFTHGAEHCSEIVSSEVVQRLLREDRRFDLVFLEIMDSDCYLGFPKRYSAPYVLFSSSALPAWIGDWIRNPTESAYVPEPFCRVGGRLDFLSRMRNVLCQGLYRFLNYLYNTRVAVDVVREHFHSDSDTLVDLKKNVSMIFVNSFHAFGPVRPMLPNVIEIGGIHIRDPEPIPEDIEKFLNESTEGVIVFSMGSMVKAHTLAPQKRDAFVKAFAGLRQRVLWKWESDLPDAPPNVMVVPWLPQSDVLGHPNVKLFLAHGGIHGVMEAVHHGVPLLGIPLYADQKGNLLNLEAAGAARLLELDEITPDSLSTAIGDMLDNGGYTENAKRLSRIMRDRPMPPLEQAIFWTEYILRNGAPASAAPLLRWYQHLLLDVFAACGLFCISIYFLFRYIKFFKDNVMKISFFRPPPSAVDDSKQGCNDSKRK